MPSDKKRSTAPTSKTSRRDAFKVASAVLGGAVVGIDSSQLLAHFKQLETGSWHFFSSEDALTVEAIAAQIIPADRDPGAKQAGVVFFIDQQLIGPYQRYQDTYRSGLKSLAATCQQIYGHNFTALSAGEQHKIIAAIEASRVPPNIWKSPAPAEFFNLLLAHTMQGFYGSPRHGGNKNFASFKMLGIENERVIDPKRTPPTQ